MDEADDSISDDEEPREEQIPSLATAEGKTTTSPPPAVEPQKEAQEERKPEPEKEAEPIKEKSDVQQEEEKPQGNVMTLFMYQMMVKESEFC